MRYRFTAILPVVFSLISPAAMAEGGFSKAALTAKAMHGDTQAQFDLCRLYQIEDSPNYAMPWCEKAAH